MSTLRVEALEQPDGTAFVFNNKNLLINGGMNVWERSTSASVNTDTYSTVDRWRTTVNGLGVFTVSRSTDVPSGQGFGYSTKWDCTTADASPAAADSLKFEQRIEGQNLQHLLYGNSGAKKLTASFWVKSNKTGVYTCGLYSADNSGRHIESSFTINSASTWEKKEITFDGDTSGVLDNDNAESLRFWIWLGAGSNYSSGTHATSWAAYAEADVLANSQVNLADSTSNEFYITGCQLEVGSTASGFEFEPYANTLQKCQRYFYFFIFVNSANGFNDAYHQSLGFNFHPIAFPTTMRVGPTATADTSTDWSIVNSSRNDILVGSKNIAYHQIRAISTGRFYALYTGTTNGIDFDAEL